MPPASCEEELQRVCRSDHGAGVGLSHDSFEIVGIFLTLFPYFSVDPSFVTETGTCRQSPIEIAAEKDPELSLHLVKTKLSQLICQERETVKTKEDFAGFLKMVSPTTVRMENKFWTLCQLEGAFAAGNTLLQEAVSKDKTDIVSLLLKHG